MHESNKDRTMSFSLKNSQYRDQYFENISLRKNSASFIHTVHERTSNRMRIERENNTSNKDVRDSRETMRRRNVRDL
jgi:hypothetical protein